MQALHCLALLAMVANISLALTCCMAMAGGMSSSATMTQMDHASMDHASLDHGSVHHTSDHAGHEGHGEGHGAGGCDCMSACMGMAPALPENAQIITPPAPAARLALVPRDEATLHAGLIRSVSARAPPALT